MTDFDSDNTNGMSIKRDELIKELKNLNKEYSYEDYEFLKSERLDEFYIFMFGIDWGKIYSYENRITTYDILISSNSKDLSKKRKSFLEAYEEIKNLFDGNISTIEQLTSCKRKIQDRISNGLNHLLEVKHHKKKGLNEFFLLILEKLASSSYEFTNFKEPYLKGDYQSSRFKVDLFDKFIPAFFCAVIFNEKYKDQLKYVIVDHFFALHVLIRHVVPFKFHWELLSNPEKEEKIMNGYGKFVNITAHDIEGGVKVISTDGEFFYPNLSTNQDDYYKYLCNNSNNISLEKTAKSLYDKLSELTLILKENINGEFSPNIIYKDSDLFGFEFDKRKYKEDHIIFLGSFYPLNGEHQKLYGISETEYNQIINKNDIPDLSSIKINSSR